ncbi:MAG: HisA/HisF-related TIM barrel protein, partial [Pseudomonadota bacterium]
ADLIDLLAQRLAQVRIDVAHRIDRGLARIDRGAGEVVLNCMGNDGVRRGYDIEQLAAARERCPVPLIASGGAGELEHFSDVFVQADVDGALAATVFHTEALKVRDVKAHVAEHNVSVRL